MEQEQGGRDLSSRRMVLYSFVHFDRSMRVRWLAHELGIEIEERRLDYAGGEHRSAAHLARHPFGLVPVAEIDGRCLWESVAICQALVEQRPDCGLEIPPGAPGREDYLAWLMFAGSTFDAATFEVFHPTAVRPDEARAKAGMARLFPLLVQLARHLHERDYLVAGRFLLPDLVLGYSLQLLHLIRVLKDYPALEAYRRRLAERPAAVASRVFSRTL
ncbi:MAG: glutathione S-transferase [Lysobacteraceae bacterium]|nr:MAG: glutathione S-transferase [Xanthomonadaceae bacterium]